MCKWNAQLALLLICFALVDGQRVSGTCSGYVFVHPDVCLTGCFSSRHRARRRYSATGRDAWLSRFTQRRFCGCASDPFWALRITSLTQRILPVSRELGAAQPQWQVKPETELSAGLGRPHPNSTEARVRFNVFMALWANKFNPIAPLSF